MPWGSRAKRRDRGRGAIAAAVRCPEQADRRHGSVRSQNLAFRCWWCRHLSRGVTVGLEGAEAAAAPACGEVARIVAGVVRSTEPIGEIKEGAEQGRAVVVGQFDEAGFLDQAAEFDEVTGALAAFLGPIAHVGASLAGIEPMTLDCC